MIRFVRQDPLMHISGFVYSPRQYDPSFQQRPAHEVARIKISYTRWSGPWLRRCTVEVSVLLCSDPRLLNLALLVCHIRHDERDEKSEE
jgi:hypothetical protein